MKGLILICASLLLIGVMNLPIGYYTFLRIIVTIGAVDVIIKDFENGLNLWVISFGIIAILFNPIIPIYLNNKEVWIPIDVLCGLLFIIKFFSLAKKKNIKNGDL